MSRPAALLPVACGLLLAGCVPHMPDLGRRSYEFAGDRMSYRLFIPPDLPPDEAVPLVVALHRYTESGAAMAYMSGFNEVARREGFVTIYPDGPGNWFDAFDVGRDDVGMILAAIDDVAELQPIDRDRTYLTGASNGGFMAFKMACEVPGSFAAVAPVMALMSARLARDPPAVARPPVPILIINGTEDRIVKWNATEIHAGRPVDVLTVGQGVSYWVRRNGCESTPVVEPLTDADPDDRTRVTRVRYEGGDAPVVLYRVDGGGHTWPGGREPAPGFIVGRMSRDFSATETIWRFFSKHRRGRPQHVRSDGGGVPDGLHLDVGVDPPG